MTAMTPEPANSPLMIAWNAYKASEDYENAKRWAAYEHAVDGSLWAAFSAGFAEGRSVVARELAVDPSVAGQ